jgi:hypothetical protein
MGMQPPAPTSAVLAARLSAQLVHDLAGGIQGLKAALALLQESPDEASRAEACALACQSAEDLEARLAFCRAAFAGAGTLSPAELERLAQTPFASRRGRLRWLAPDPGAPPALRQVALLFVQFASAGLATGGEATVRLEASGEGWRARLEASGPRLRFDRDALAGLKGERPEGGFAGRWAAGAFARALVIEAGGRLTAEAGDTAAALEAWLPDPLSS